uniref:Uncharacterized protein n=1 Tax=Oryza glumipatula TaxID=40148 RepID=A0A0E0AAX2_9ORYZ
MSKCDDKVAKQLGNEAARHEEARCRGDVVTKRWRGNKQVRGRGCMAMKKRHNKDMQVITVGLIGHPRITYDPCPYFAHQRAGRT